MASDFGPVDSIDENGDRSIIAKKCGNMMKLNQDSFALNGLLVG